MCAGFCSCEARDGTPFIAAGKCFVAKCCDICDIVVAETALAHCDMRAAIWTGTSENLPHGRSLQAAPGVGETHFLVAVACRDCRIVVSGQLWRQCRGSARWVGFDSFSASPMGFEQESRGDSEGSVPCLHIRRLEGTGFGCQRADVSMRGGSRGEMGLKARGRLRDLSGTEQGSAGDRPSVGQARGLKGITGLRRWVELWHDICGLTGTYCGDMLLLSYTDVSYTDAQVEGGGIHPQTGG